MAAHQQAPDPTEPFEPWRNGLYTTPISASILTYAAGALLDVTQAPAGTVAMTGAALTAGSLASAAATSYAEKYRHGQAGFRWWHYTYTALTAGAVGGWLTYAAATDPVSTGGFWSWAAGSVFLTACYRFFRESRAEPIAQAWDRHHGDDPDAPEEQPPTEWEQILERAGHRGVRELERIETRAGYTLRLGLPEGGSVKFRTLHSNLEGIEIAAQRIALRPDALRVEKGATAAEVLLHVNVHDILKELVFLPRDNRHASINEPIAIGLFEDGEEATLTLREVAALIVGIRGSGKSNLVNVLIAQLTRCVDVVIWMIDLKVRTAKPWLQPWLDGTTDKPVLDWVAFTPAEAELMLTSGVAGVTARTTGYDGEKITPSPETPAIIILFEEVAILLGDHAATDLDSSQLTSRLKNLTMQMTQLGRSEAIDSILITQRGTVSMVGSGDLKSQLDLRIGLGVASTMDATFVFPDDSVAADIITKAASPGTALLKARKGARIAPLKVFRMKYDDIYPLAAANAARRPALDTITARALGAAYADRWGRTVAYLNATKGGAPLPAAQPATSVLTPPRPPAAPPAAPRPGGQPSIPGFDLMNTMPGLHLPGIGEIRPGQPLPAQKEQPEPAAADPVLAEFERITAGFDDTPEPAGPDLMKPNDPQYARAKQRMYAYIGAAGDTGRSPADITNHLTTEGLTVNYKTLMRWLKEGVENARLTRGGRGNYALAATADAEATRRINDVLPLAIEQVVAKQHASTAMLQRNLRVNAADATALMTFLEQQGIVGPARPDGTHEVLLTPDQLRDAIDGTEAGE